MASNTIVAIDGPAAAGKTTVARMLAAQLGALLFDTGTLYRAVTLLAIRTGTPTTDGAALAALAAANAIAIKPPSAADGRPYDVLLNDEDVTWAIRDEAVDAAVSAVSAHFQVRAALLDHQRRIARQGRVVVVGRDIGTVVVPEASVKVFLLASPGERARRRHEEVLNRGGETTVNEILAEINRRDTLDSSRDVAPLLPAVDAKLVETDGQTVPEVVAVIRCFVDAAWPPMAVQDDEHA